MGWGICFALDDNNVLYCADGCKWKARKADMPDRPSGCEYVLEYFERDLHSELDMIRDECPGTASALKEAIEEYDPRDIYEYLSEAEKIKRSQDYLERMNQQKIQLEQSLIVAKQRYIEAKNIFKNYAIPVNTSYKYRAHELRAQIYPLQLELNMEDSALEVDRLEKLRKTINRNIKLENA
jgi:hypothetical protein